MLCARRQCAARTRRCANQRARVRERKRQNGEEVKRAARVLLKSVPRRVIMREYAKRMLAGTKR